MKQDALTTLAARLQGELHTDELHRMLYATDASVYRQRPAAVAVPATVEDLQLLIGFAREYNLPLIPRAAGTSLAGQVVGPGLIVDTSKYFNRILEINPAERWVRVQPGVIRDELNHALRPHGLHFGPNTATANRCMLGGMVGNNSCGSSSIVYGSTRDHLLELEVLLSDGSPARFGPVSAADFHRKRKEETTEGRLYAQLYEALSPAAVRERIAREYPRPEIQRRNTGYAIDLLARTEIFSPGGPEFNFCTLLAGSEGTLAFTTAIRLSLDPLPPPGVAVVAVHFHSIDGAMEAVQPIMQHGPTACELMDRVILDLTRENRQQQRNRFFVEGDPAAVLLVEFRSDTDDEAAGLASRLAQELQAGSLGYAWPLIRGAHTAKAWELRAAGLGVLANLPGDRKAVACIEDTAVALPDLPAYIREFGALMDRYGQQAVYYAHAGAGELHLRPILNLREEGDRQLFHDITADVARLVKRYRGSLSGEHGDGRVRAGFLPLMIGAENYELLRQIKRSWDPAGLFNPGKIIDAPPMTEDLRYLPVPADPLPETAFDYSSSGGLLRLAEKCNGSGDCRKLSFSGGTMCPSYRATRNERDSTRGRANALREVLTMDTRQDPFLHPALEKAMELCISCKGCTAECPSNVDMATLKAEYLYQRGRRQGIGFRDRIFGRIADFNRLGSYWPWAANFILRRSGWLKRLLGVAPERSLPLLSRQSFDRWWQQTGRELSPPGTVRGEVLIFVDEFTRYNEAVIGRQAVELLTRLGYRVCWPDHRESGRAAISKGMLDRARDLAQHNVQAFAGKASADRPVVGIEPSAILSFRDEYPRLLRGEWAERARRLAPHVLTIEEFLAREAQQGRIDGNCFHSATCHVLLHGHCHQKALSELGSTALLLSLPENYTVEVIPSGCCGMAGSFGYEARHYAVSMQIGELVLLPAVRAARPDSVICAPGTSCRHQITDGAGRTALHPVTVLRQALV